LFNIVLLIMEFTTSRKREASALPKNKAKQLKAGHRSPKAKADAKRLRLSNKSELVKIVKELNGGCFKSIDDAMTHFIEGEFHDQTVAK
jgi:hypothetical protein